jgi:hypothetical protein
MAGQKMCDYELPSKPFTLCMRDAVVEIELNGCYCSQHAKIVLGALRLAGIERQVTRLKASNKESS